jgi:hypothetical protein
MMNSVNYLQAIQTALLAVVSISFSTALVAQETIQIQPQSDATEVNAGDEKDSKKPAVKEEKPEKTRELTVALKGDKLTFLVPVKWKSKKVSPMMQRITKHDLIVPKVDSDPKDGRMTLSLSGGGTKANIDRWKSQFRLPVGDKAEEAVKIAKKKLDGYEISIVQIEGTFMDSMGGGPFSGGKKVSRPDYMMRAVILTKEGSTPMSPKCFVKLVGPKATVKK